MYVWNVLSNREHTYDGHDHTILILDAWVDWNIMSWHFPEHYVSVFESIINTQLKNKYVKIQKYIDNEYMHTRNIRPRWFETENYDRIKYPSNCVRDKSKYVSKGKEIDQNITSECM